jgi:CheY-like chemotaxis protein
MEGTMVTVLVAEDNASLRFLYALWLESEGYTVWAAADGREAIALLAENGLPDAAVLDVEMPHVDGLCVCRYLRERGSTGPIVFVTGHQEARGSALAAGATDVISKPCADAPLLAALRSSRYAQHRPAA